MILENESVYIDFILDEKENVLHAMHDAVNGMINYEPVYGGICDVEKTVGLDEPSYILVVQIVSAQKSMGIPDSNIHVVGIDLKEMFQCDTYDDVLQHLVLKHTPTEITLKLRTLANLSAVYHETFPEMFKEISTILVTKANEYNL